MSKAKCDCGKMAVYVYMPGFSGGANPYFCDDCISSSDDIGCSCNWHHTNVNAYDPPIDNPELPEGIENKDWRWVEHPGDEYMGKITKADGVWQYLDEKGRPYPCVEYDYDKDGFDETDEEE
jgi:hypothetical protein